MGNKTIISIIIGCILAPIILFVVLMGPKGISNNFYAWKASAYGSNWLIIQYSANGDVIHHWDLSNSAVHNEPHSDGIYFQTNEGTVHLSGFYIYIENASDKTKTQLLRRNQ